jgi:hypothetical protein
MKCGRPRIPAQSPFLEAAVQRCESVVDVGCAEGYFAAGLARLDGGELDLFTPEVVSAIRHCDLIIERHGSDAKENLAFVRRFDDTVAILDHPASDTAAVERLKFLGTDAARMATEYRSFQPWLLRQRSQPD